VFTERGYYGLRVLARDLEKHRKASMALDERRDVRVVRSGEKVSFPVAWHGALLGLGEAGSHEKAAHHAHVARGHVIHGRGHAEEAVKAHLEEHGKK
jgi:hypothetical protein